MQKILDPKNPMQRPIRNFLQIVIIYIQVVPSILSIFFLTTNFFYQKFKNSKRICFGVRQRNF